MLTENQSGVVNALACYRSRIIVVISQFLRERVFESHRCRDLFCHLFDTKNARKVDDARSTNQFA